MLLYKFDVMEALREAGYNPARIRKEKILGESTLTQIRKGEVVSAKALDQLCALLDMQPGNIIKYRPSDDPKKS